MRPRSGARAPIPLLAGFILFLVVVGYLVAASLAPPDVLEFAPSPLGPRDSARAAAVDTLTIDAQDQSAWRFFDFERGAVSTPPDTAGWDLAFRRFHVIASGALADAGPIPFDSLREAPALGYVATAFARDTVNPVVARWYRYGMLTHLLSPNGRVYAVHTAQGHFAKFEFLSYYCPGIRPGCLTFRYVFQPSGARAFR